MEDYVTDERLNTRSRINKLKLKRQLSSATSDSTLCSELFFFTKYSQFSIIQRKNLSVIYIAYYLILTNIVQQSSHSGHAAQLPSLRHVSDRSRLGSAQRAWSYLSVRVRPDHCLPHQPECRPSWVRTYLTWTALEWRSQWRAAEKLSRQHSAVAAWPPECFISSPYRRRTVSSSSTKQIENNSTCTQHIPD